MALPDATGERAAASGRSRRHREQSPFTGNSLQGMGAAVGELDVRSGHEVANGTRDEHLPGTGEAGDASGDMYGHAGEISAALDALTGVQPGPDL